MGEVTAELIEPVTGISDITNISYYTFSARNEAGDSLKITPILPKTYEEGLKYLDGSKRFQMGEEARRYSDEKI